MSEGADQVLWRTYHIKVSPFASQKSLAEVLKLLKTLRRDCGGAAAGIRGFSVAPNLNMDFDITHVLVVILDDHHALQRFSQHSAHVLAMDKLSFIANWSIGDFYGYADLFTTD